MDEITALDATMHGTWCVRTASSQHVFDIQADGEVFYTRLPGQDSEAFAYDGTLVRLTRIGAWPTVGEQHITFYDEHRQPWLVEQWRVSSVCRSITHLGDAQVAALGLEL